METKRSNNNAGLHPPNHKRWTSGSSQDLWALPWWTNWQTSETIRLVDRTPTTRTTTQEAQQKLEPRMKVRANTVDNDSRCVHLVLLMKFSWISGSGQSLYSTFWGEQLDRFDRDTCLGVGVSMNDELSPFLTTTFPTVALCFHSGALHLNSSQNRALYSLNACSYNEPSVVWSDPENSGSQRPHLSLTETATQHTCLPSSV